MDKMWFDSSDGETTIRVYSWVVWGKKEGCILFDRNYSHRGHAVRRAKKLIENGDHACVVKSDKANYFQVMKGNLLSDFLRGAFNEG